MNYHLEDLQTYLQVAETGSITQAAERLNVSKSVISKRIVRLEQALGVALLHRSTRGVSLTEKGLSYHLRVQRLLEDLNLAAEEVAEHGDELAGQLRMTAPLSFGAQYLGELLFPLVAAHPRLQLHLDLEDRTVDLVREGYDLGIRVTRTPAPDLKARRLALSRRVVCCSPEYLQRHGQPQSFEELLQHQAIGYANVSPSQLWQFLPGPAGGEGRSLAMRGRVTVNNGESSYDAAVAGLGVAMLPMFIAAPGLCSGKLVRVASFAEPVPDIIYAVYPQTRYVSRQVRSVIDHLVDALAGSPPWERAVGACVRGMETAVSQQQG